MICDQDGWHANKVVGYPIASWDEREKKGALHAREEKRTKYSMFKYGENPSVHTDTEPNTYRFHHRKEKRACRPVGDI